MKRIQLIFIIIFLASFARCSDSDDGVVIPILELSEEKIEFSNDAGMQDIQVLTNTGDAFHALWSGVEWGGITPTSDGFRVEVKQNPGGNRRKTTIEIILRNGDMQKTLSIEQLGQDLVLDIDDSDINFRHFKQEIRIPFKTNSSELKAVAKDSWLTVEMDFVREELIITVNTNEKQDQRTSSIDIVRTDLEAAGEEGESLILKSIIAHQEAGLYYLLPNLSFGLTISSLINFELERGSQYVSGNWRQLCKFNAVSIIFSSIDYIMTDGEQPVTESAIAHASSENALKKEEFIEYLISNSFLFLFDTNDTKTHIYWRESDMIQASIEPKNKIVTFTKESVRPTL